MLHRRQNTQESATKSGYRSDNPLFVRTGGSEDIGYGHRLLLSLLVWRQDLEPPEPVGNSKEQTLLSHPGRFGMTSA